MENNDLVVLTHNQKTIVEKVNSCFWILFISMMLCFTVINYKVNRIRREINVKARINKMEGRILDSLENIIVNDIKTLGLDD